MIRLVFIFLSVFYFCSTFAQDSNSDKEIRLIDNWIDSAQFYLENNIDSTSYYASKALEFSLSKNYQKGLLKSYNQLGNCAQRKGELDSALFLYNKVLRISKKTDDDKGMAIVLNNIGIIQLNKGDYNQALASFFNAIEYEIIVNDSIGIAEGYNNVGVVHYYMGDMDNTLKYFKKSIEINEALGDLKILKKGYINIGAIAQYHKKYDEALSYYQRGLDIALELEEQTDIHLALHNIAQLYAIKGEYQKAEKNYLKSLDFYEKFENQRGIASEYTNLGNLYRDQSNYVKAKSYYEKSIAITKKKGFLKELETAYGDLAELYALEKDYKAAFLSAKDFITLKDSLLNVENSKSFAELRTKYETAEKEKALIEEKIKTETLAREKTELDLKAAQRKQWIVALLAFIIIGLVVFAYIIQRNKRIAQAEKDNAIIKERDQGIKSVIQAQEVERKRISKDLHDGVGQQLGGLKIAFQKLQSELISEKNVKEEEMNKLSQILSETAEDVRSISHQMMPKALTELGLIPALEDMLSKSFGHNNMEYTFEHHGIKDRLDEQIEISLYRISQELVNNILKHAEAQKVSFQLLVVKDKLVLIVEDNGKGIEEKETDGQGLLNIKSRLNTIHGEVNLEPSPNSGTVATIRIPLKNGF